MIALEGARRPQRDNPGPARRGLKPAGPPEAFPSVGDKSRVYRIGSVVHGAREARGPALQR